MKNQYIVPLCSLGWEVLVWQPWLNQGEECFCTHLESAFPRVSSGFSWKLTVVLGYPNLSPYLSLSWNKEGEVTEKYGLHLNKIFIKRYRSVPAKLLFPCQKSLLEKYTCWNSHLFNKSPSPTWNKLFPPLFCSWRLVLITHCSLFQLTAQCKELDSVFKGHFSSSPNSISSPFRLWIMYFAQMWTPNNFVLRHHRYVWGSYLLLI